MKYICKVYPHLPVPYIFGTFGSQLPIYQVTINPGFQIYRELGRWGYYGISFSSLVVLTSGSSNKAPKWKIWESLWLSQTISSALSFQEFPALRTFPPSGRVASPEWSEGGRPTQPFQIPHMKKGRMFCFFGWMCSIFFASAHQGI